MTRKDYILIAEALKEAKPREAYPGKTCDGAARNEWERCVSEICAMLGTDNPRFDREKFNRACERYT